MTDGNEMESLRSMYKKQLEINYEKAINKTQTNNTKYPADNASPVAQLHLFLGNIQGLCSFCKRE